MSNKPEITTVHFFKRFLKRFKCEIAKRDLNIIDSLGKQWCLEIFDTNRMQIFRDLSLMDTCSYSLDELVSNSAENLWDVEQDGEELFLSGIRSAISDRKSMTISNSLSYRKTERFSAEKLSHYAEFKHFIPLFIDKKVIGVVVVSKMHESQPFSHRIKRKIHLGSTVSELLKALILSGIYDLLKSLLFRITVRRFYLSAPPFPFQFSTQG